MDTAKKVAYFSMEVGLTAKIPTYAGGLGILAGDLLKASADAHFPMVGVTLLTKHGYFYQNVKTGKQEEEPVSWRVDDFLKPTDAKVFVEINHEPVAVGAWLCEIFSPDGYLVPLFFLHTDCPENSENSRKITDFLYGAGKEYRLKQEIVLGIGGTRILKQMGFNELEKYHMNEGHSSLLAMELKRELNDIHIVKNMCIFTTHTPVPAGHDKFDIKLAEKLLEKNIFDLLPQEYKDEGILNMTALALDYSGYINGVAKKHTEISKSMFPNYPIHSVTNGVHTQSWVSSHFAYLFDKYTPGWRLDPDNLKNADLIPLEEVWKAHFECKKQIIDFANAYTNAGLDYDFFTLGWARRFTSYKQPEMLLENIEKLKSIADKTGPIQIIYAGKAHPADDTGKEIIEKTILLSKELRDKVTMVYLPNYDIYLAKFVTSGVDVWLNTPTPPQEASGTSGMKCAVNGVPHLSILDGWWREGCVKDRTGWSFDTADELYALLEKSIIPRFYQDRKSWQEIMRQTIMINGSYFSSKRMLDDYIRQAYNN